MTKRLLTAEDHPVVVAALEEVLNNNGFRVVGVSQRWDRVVDDYANLLPDVCLIDVRGPPDDGTGLDAAAAVQKRPGGCSCVYKRYGDAFAHRQRYRHGMQRLHLKDVTSQRTNKDPTRSLSGVRSLERQLVLLLCFAWLNDTLWRCNVFLCVTQCCL